MSTISAGTTSTTTLIHSGDTTGSLVLKTNDTGSGGTTAVTIDTSQNVGIGTSSPRNKSDTVGNIGIYSSGASSVGSPLGAQLYIGDSNYNTSNYYNAAPGIGAVYDATYASAAALAFYTFAGSLNSRTERMRIDSSGNVGIGTSSPSYALDIRSSSLSGALGVNLTSGTTLTTAQGSTTNVDMAFVTKGVGLYTWTQGSTERMRINSNGTVGIGVAGQSAVSGVNGYLSVKNTANDGAWGLAIETTGATTNRGIGIVYGNSPNSTGQEFAYWLDSTTLRFSVRSNGGIANYSANNANLSDERTKTDIQNAGGYLAKICAIPVRTFKYKDQTDDLLNLGVIAQEVEAVAPELVDASGFGETPEDGIPLKAIYQTDLQYALMKCIQEQQVLIQALTDRITALEGK